MTPEELAAALDALPDDQVLRAFSDAVDRRTEVALDPAELALLELATPTEAPAVNDEDEEVYQRLFGPPQPIPLSDEDRATYEAVFGPGTGVDA